PPAPPSPPGRRAAGAWKAAAPSPGRPRHPPTPLGKRFAFSTAPPAPCGDDGEKEPGKKKATIAASTPRWGWITFRTLAWITFRALSPPEDSCESAEKIPARKSFSAGPGKRSPAWGPLHVTRR